MAIIYVSHNHGDDANDGSSWALAKKTIGGASTISAAGDEIRIEKSDDAVSTGVNATFTNRDNATEGTIELATALTADVDMCDSGWKLAGGANATHTTTATIVKEGTAYLSQAKGTGTGKLCYKTLDTGAGLDFSSYEQISFWFRSSVTTLDGELRICLCSDETGDTPVDNFDVPAITLANYWRACVVNKGSALGSAIKSVALYSMSATATKTMYLDDIIACGAASADSTITLLTLIGKENGSDGWFHPFSIKGTTIRLGNFPNNGQAYYRGYYGVAETTTLYKRNPHLVDPHTSTTTAINTITVSGSEGSTITFKGGYEYNTTNQNGESFYCGQNGVGYFIYLTNNMRYIIFQKISVSFYGCAYYINPANTSNSSDNINITCNNLTANSQGINTKYFSNGEFNIDHINNNTMGLNISALCDSLAITITDLNSNCEHNLSYYGIGFDSVSNVAINIQNSSNNRDVIYLINSRNINIEIENEIFWCYAQSILFDSKCKNCIANCNNGIYGRQSGGSLVYLRGYNHIFNTKHIKKPVEYCIDIIDARNIVAKITDSLEDYGSGSYGAVSIFDSSDIVIDCPVITGGARYGVVNNSANSVIKNAVMSGHSYSDINTASSDGKIYLDNCELNSTVPVYVANMTDYVPEISDINRSGDSTSHAWHVGYGNIVTNTSELVHGSIGWTLSPTDTTFCDIGYPINAPLYRRYVKIGEKLLFRVWAKRDNTGINGGIRILPDGLNGLTSTSESKITADADTWEQLSIDFTATTDTMITLEMFAYGGSTYNLYLDPYQLPGVFEFKESRQIYIPSSEKIITN